MAAKEEEKIRAELREERAALADAVNNLRGELGAAADVSGKLKSKLPLVAAGVFGDASVVCAPSTLPVAGAAAVGMPCVAGSAPSAACDDDCTWATVTGV